MASFVGSPVDSGQLMPNAFGYAHSGFTSLIAKQVLPATHPQIVLEIDHPIPVVNDGPEHYVPSHVPPERIRRAFLGFSNWHDARSYRKPPEETQRWYALSLLGRDAEGRPTGISIASATAKDRDYVERWSLGRVLWRSDQADAAETAKVLADHPWLAPTIEAWSQRP